MNHPLEDLSPFATITSRQIHDSPWITFNEDNILFPNEKSDTYGILYFENLSVGIILLNSQSNIWLVGQYRYPIKSFSWEIPMGEGLLGTDPLEIAKRELKEETSLIVNRWKRLLTLHTYNSVTDEKIIVFLATKLEQRQPSSGENEVLTACKASLVEALEMVMQIRSLKPLAYHLFFFLPR